MKWYKVFLLSFFVLSSCTKAPKAHTPEAALSNYVSAAFSAKSTDDRSKLVAMSDGDAKVHLEGMSDDEFQKQFLDSKMRLIKLRTRDLRKENDGNVSLVYEISFQDAGAGGTAVHTNKKIAFLSVGEDGEWKIRATKNMKSFLEKKEDLLITPETTYKDNQGDNK